jgi:aspartyl-tRNA(Asn)/glutamyl-tRNA(Gln) amidotransferase subunit C
MDAKNLKEIAGLARLRIEDNEMDSMLQDFNQIMDYVAQVKELDVSFIEEKDLYPHHENSLRKDRVAESLSRDDIAKIAPKYENGYVVVPKVIET